MKPRGERSVRELYDRTRHGALEASEEQVEGCGKGQAEASEHERLSMEEVKYTVRKRPISRESPHVRTESGTCNVCSAPCSSCSHRLALMDSKIECGSSETCCPRTETDTLSFVGSNKRLHSKGRENDDEFSATSSHASYSEPAGNKATVRSSIVGDSSEVDMPAKRRRLLSQDTGVYKAECHDDSNSCVTTGISVGRKLPLDMKNDKLCSSASSRDLAKGCKDNSTTRSENRDCQINQSKLRSTSIEESPRKKIPDFRDKCTSSSEKMVPAELPCATKKLLRTQSSVSPSQGLSSQRQDGGLGGSHENLFSEPCGKASTDRNNADGSSGGNLTPCTLSGDKHVAFTDYDASMTNKISAPSSPRDPHNDISCLRNEVQAPAGLLSKNGLKSGNDKQDRKQNCSNATTSKKSKIQHEIDTEGGNNEVLIDVNVCDICGDIGREYLLATCTRCLEGAEHTYCMRVKLDKVPDGEWLCEECQLKESQNKRISNSHVTCGTSAAKFLDGKNQNSESIANRKKLQVFVSDFEAQPITSGTPTGDQLGGKNENSENVANRKKLEAQPPTCGTPTAEYWDRRTQNSENIASHKKLQAITTGTEARQVTCDAPTAERLAGKHKNSGLVTHYKNVQVFATDPEARPTSCGTPTAECLDRKNKKSETMANCKKLQVVNDMESLPSSEGLRTSPKLGKRHAESASSLSPQNRGVFSHENSFKNSDDGNFQFADNAPVRSGQAVKSSQTLSRSYSLGKLSKVSAQVPSPRGVLSKQLSFNNLNTGPKVKQLDGVPSKLKPAKQSPRNPREKGLTRKLVRSSSFKNEGAVRKDISSLKQKQSLNLSRGEEPRILKPIREQKLLERRVSFHVGKPNVLLSPEPDRSMKTGVLKIDLHNVKIESSLLKDDRKPGSMLKKPSPLLSKSDKQDTAKHEKPIGVVSGKDGYAAKTSDSLTPRESGITKESKTRKAYDAASAEKLIENNDEVPNKSENLSGLKDDMAPEITSQDAAWGSSHNLIPKRISDQRERLKSTGNNSSNTVEPVLLTEDEQPEKSKGLPIESTLVTPDKQLNEPDLKPLAEDFCDQSVLGNPFRALAIPEQNYIWQGIFEISRPGMSLEIFEGIQAHLSTCVSPKVLEVVKKLPQRIRLEEVPRASSWPLQFQEVEPSEDNIALFFFAKDLESYERTYGKLLGSMLVDDSSLRANIGDIELLIFPSDKLTQNIQRWNSLFFLWGVFYARKTSCSTEHPDTGTDHCVPKSCTESVGQRVCAPKVVPSLGIDLNECPDDDLFGAAISPELEADKSSTYNRKPLLNSKHEDGKPDSLQMCAQGSASAGPVTLHGAVASFSVACVPTITLDCSTMISDYPNAASGSAGTASGDNMEEENYVERKAPFCADQCADHTAMGSPTPTKRPVKICSHLSFMEARPQHSSGPSKVPCEANALNPMANFISLDDDSEYKMRRISDGVHSIDGLGDGQFRSKCLSKIHPLPDRQRGLLVRQHDCGGASDPGLRTEPDSQNVIHLLSSDDEDSPESSTSRLGRASVNEESLPGEGSPLLSLSFLGAGSKQNLASFATTGDDGSLSLSLGLPGIDEEKKTQPSLEVKQPSVEVKQFLPEKPGINTSWLL